MLDGVVQRLVDAAETRARWLDCVAADGAAGVAHGRLVEQLAHAAGALLDGAQAQRTGGRVACLGDLAAWALVALAWERPGGPPPDRGVLGAHALRDALAIPSWRYGGPPAPRDLDDEFMAVAAAARDGLLDAGDDRRDVRLLLGGAMQAAVATVAAGPTVDPAARVRADAALERFAQARQARGEALLASYDQTAVAAMLGADAPGQASSMLQLVLSAWRTPGQAAGGRLGQVAALELGAQADELGAMALALVDLWRIETGDDGGLGERVATPELAGAIAERLTWLEVWTHADARVGDVGEMWFACGLALLDVVDELAGGRAVAYLGLPSEATAAALITLGVLSAVCQTQAAAGPLGP